MAGGIQVGQLTEDIELGGSGGAKNFSSIGNCENVKLDEILTGKSTAWGDIGTLGGALSLDEVLPLSGKKSLLYTADATAANSVLDWFKIEEIVEDAYKGRVLDFKFQYQNNMPDSSVQLIVKMKTTGDIIYNESLPEFIDGDNKAKEISFRFESPLDGLIDWGLHIINPINSGEIKLDEIIITPDLMDERPIDAYHQEEGSLVRVKQCIGIGSVDDKIIIFDRVLESRGSELSYSVNPEHGSVFTCLSDGYYSFTLTFADVSNNQEFGITRNAEGFLSTYIGSLMTSPTEEHLVIASNRTGDASGLVNTCTYSGPLKAGDTIRGHIHGTAPHTIGQESYFTGAKVGSLTRSIPLIDSTVDIPVSELRMDKVTGRGTGAEAYTVQFSDLATIRGEALAVDSSNGSVFTILKDGLLSITTNNLVSNSTIYLSKNTANAAATPLNSEMISEQGDLDTDIQNIGASLTVKAGDKIRVSTSETTPASDRSRIILVLQETKVAVALSNVKPQFEDVDSMVKLSGGSGVGSASYVRRFSSLLEMKGKAVEYTDSPTDGAFFTIKEDGVYSISYSDYLSDNAHSISLNANPAIGAASVPTGQSLAAQSNQAASFGDIGSTSWSGYLRVGDILRPHLYLISGLVENHAFTSFTITKQALPSIAEVDVTPFLTTEISDGEVGQIIMDAGEESPNNFLYCNGGSHARSQFPALFERIGTRYGAIDSDHFNVPDFRGYFPRGWDDGRGVDIDRLLGSDQDDMVGPHTHPVDSAGTSHSGGSRIMGGLFGDQYQGLTAAENTGSETRPLNIAVKFYIRYKKTIETVYAVEDMTNDYDVDASSAGVLSNFNGATDWISLVSHTSTGAYRYKLNDAIFSERCLIEPTALGGGTRLFAIDWHDNYEFTIYIRSVATSGVDNEHSISATKRGADRYTPEKQIVALTDFPKVNNQMSQHIQHLASNNTLLDLNGELRFNLADQTTSGDTLIVATDNAGDTRTDFICQQNDTIAHVHFNMGVNTTGYAVTIWKNGIQVATGNTCGSASWQSTVSSSVKLNKGDYITVGANSDGAYNNADPFKLSIVAEAQELKSVGNLAGGENVFSARIANNGTASITSESTSFIQSVNRPSEGVVEVVFKPGFFAVTPAVQVNQELVSALYTSVGALTKDGFLTETNDNNGTKSDRDIMITVHRQAEDHRDVQEQIIQLDDFPRVNRTLMESFRCNVDINSGAPYVNSFSEVYDKTSSLITTPEIVSGEIVFTAQRNCHVITAPTHYGENNTSGLWTSLNGVRIAHNYGVPTANTTSSGGGVAIEMQAGDTLITHYQGQSTSDTAYFSVIAMANELERVSSATLGMEIARGNMFPNSISTFTTFNVDSFRENTIKEYGYMNVAGSDFKFTATKDCKITLTGAAQNTTTGGNHMSVRKNGSTVAVQRISSNNPGSTSQVTYLDILKDGDEIDFYGYIYGGSSMFDFFNMIIEPASHEVIIAVPESKTLWQKKVLTSTISTNTTIAELGFSNLTPGKTYRLSGQLQYGTTTADYSILTTTFYNDGNSIFQSVQYTRTSAGWGGGHPRPLSTTFIATGSDITVITSADNGGSLVANNTFVILEELPLHEQTAQW